jgi:hypothetical protein
MEGRLLLQQQHHKHTLDDVREDGEDVERGDSKVMRDPLPPNYIVSLRGFNSNGV